MALHLLSTLAVEVAFRRAILPRWAEETGTAARVDWAPTSVLMRDILGGKRGDVVVMIDAQMDELVRAGIVNAASVIPIATANFGVAVAAGAAHPQIATPEGFVAAMAAARSVAYSLSGASGLHFADVMRTLGQTGVLDRATSIPAGFTAEQLLNGRADIAVQQISELMSVPGVEIAGPFPHPYQRPTDFSAACFADSRQPDAAQAFLDLLQSPAAARAYDAGGLVSRIAQTTEVSQ